MLPPLIRGAEYDAAKKELTVRFQVGTYIYKGVPNDKAGPLMRELAAAEHERVLAAFNNCIEGKYPSARVSA